MLLRSHRRGLVPFFLSTMLTASLSSSALADEGEVGHAHEHQHDEHGVSETIVVTASPLEHDRRKGHNDD